MGTGLRRGRRKERQGNEGDCSVEGCWGDVAATEGEDWIAWFGVGRVEGRPGCLACPRSSRLLIWLCRSWGTWGLYICDVGLCFIRKREREREHCSNPTLLVARWPMRHLGSLQRSQKIVPSVCQVVEAAGLCKAVDSTVPPALRLILWADHHMRAFAATDSSTSLATVSATPQDISYPLPPSPYAWTTVCPCATLSLSSLAPPCRVGLRPTMSCNTVTAPDLSAMRGYVATNSRTSVSLSSRDGFGSQLSGSFVPPMMVPPSKLLGTENIQLPSAFCLVTVASQGLATRQVCPCVCSA